MFRLNILAIFVGIGGGIGSWLFYTLIHVIFEISIKTPVEWLNENGFGIFSWIPFLLAPVIGGLIVGSIGTKVSPEAKGHGIPNIIEAINLKGGKMHQSVPFVKLITASFTIGTGGSAGVEGPIAQIGAGIGSYIGQKLKLSPKELRVLVVAGVSAGISAIFNAPIGGVLFAIEVVKRRSSINTFAPLIIASIIGALISHILLGVDPAFSEFPPIEYENPIWIPLYILFGSLCGILSAIWIKAFFAIEKSLEKMFNKRKIPSWLRPGIGALFVGLISVGIYLYFGERWETFTIVGATHEPVSNIFRGNDFQLPIKELIVVLILLFLIKLIATCFTIGSGGSGGLFMPTLIMGVLWGAFFALFASQFIGLPPSHVELFALLGMAAFFAGTIRAPFTAVIMAAEITGDYYLTLPLMFAVVFSMITSSALEPDDLYIKKIHEKGLALGESFSEVMDSVRVRQSMTPIENITKVYTSNSAQEVIEQVRNSGHEGFPVFEADKFVGVITLTDLLKLGGDVARDMQVSEILTKKKRLGLICIQPESSMNHALSIMLYYNICRLPVIEKGKEGNPILVGWLTNHDFEQTFRQRQGDFDPVEIKNHVVIYNTMGQISEQK
jgi:CIC family chloride channel protein